jgi:prepilin-type processing-associated H-X9-DG protein
MSVDFENDPEFHHVRPKKTSRRGLKLLNLVLVLVIVLSLITMLVPSRSARPAARRAQCMNNLKQIALALHNYEQEHGALPPAYTLDPNGGPLHGWRTLILPYLEQEPLYKTIDLSKPWNDAANAKAFEAVIPEFRCPESSGQPNTTTYLAVVAPGGCFTAGEPRRLADITDSHGATLMVIEAGEERAVPWMAPLDADGPSVMGLGSGTELHHQGGTNACLVDGSVRFLKASISAEVRRALISISGNDKVGAEW